MTTMPNELSDHDLLLAVRKLPMALREMLKREGASLMVGGGYLRATITGEEVSDIDVFASTPEQAKRCATALAEGTKKRLYESPNAFTVHLRPKPVQFVHRWTFDTPQEAIKSFDFTIARAAIWYAHTGEMHDNAAGTVTQLGVWRSACDDDYYQDLAAKRLVYCSPVRIEEAGGSLLRVLKFYKRGYTITVDSLAAVVARLNSGVRDIGVLMEHEQAQIITGLLREVDPLVDPDHISHLSSLKGGPDDEV